MITTLILTALLTITPPSYATDNWQNYAAHIVAGESAETESSRILVACTLLNDISRGYRPHSLYPGRWHGWRPYSVEDKQAVYLAVNTNVCDQLPVCLYLGNISDLRYWYHTGLVPKNTPVLIWTDGYRESICIPLERETQRNQRDKEHNRRQYEFS